MYIRTIPACVASCPVRPLGLAAGKLRQRKGSVGRWGFFLFSLLLRALFRLLLQKTPCSVFWSRLLNPPDLLLRFNSFLLFHSTKTSAAMAIASLTTFGSLTIHCTLARDNCGSPAECDCVWLCTSVCYFRFRPVIDALTLVLRDYLVQQKGVWHFLLLLQRELFLFWLVDHLVGLPEHFNLRNDFSSLSSSCLCAAPLSCSLSSGCPLSLWPSSPRFWCF